MSKSRSRTANTLLNIITSFGGRLVKTLLTFAIRTLFIFTLGKEYLGVNGVFTSILHVLSLAELGFSTTIVYHLYKPLAVHDETRVRLLINLYKTVYRTIGIVVMIIGLGLIPFIPVLIKDYERIEQLGLNVTLIYLIYLLQSVSSYVFLAYRQTILEADQKKYIIDTVDCIRTIFECILQAVSLFYFHSFILYMLSALLCVLLYNGANAIIAGRLYPKLFTREKAQLSRGEVVSIFKDCGAMFLFKIESVVLKATDNLVLSAAVGIEIVGLYSSYIMLINAGKSFMEKFYASVKHSMGNLFATEGIDSRFFFFEVMNLLTVILYGVFAVGIVTCIDDFILLWIGENYLIGVHFCYFIAAEIFLDGLIRNLTQIRNISGAFQQLWYRPVISIVVNIITSIILVNQYGIIGVILGTILSQILVGMTIDPFVVMNVCFKKLKPVSYYYLRNLGYVCTLCLVGAFNVALCVYVIKDVNWFTMILRAIIIVITVPSAFIVIYRKRPECKYIMNLSKKMLKKVKLA